MIRGLEPGARDRAVTIQFRTPAESSTGFAVDSWTAAAPVLVWAERLEVRGTERRAAALQTEAVFDTKWQMAYRPDLDPDLVDVPKDRRLVYQGRVFDIVAAEHVGRRDGINVMTIANTSGETA